MASTSSLGLLALDFDIGLSGGYVYLSSFYTAYHLPKLFYPTLLLVI